MSENERYDQFAAEMVRRFEDFTSWSIAHWPDRASPLTNDDFAESRKEISQLVGARLGDGSSAKAPSPSDDDAQYVNVTPMPWP